MKLQRYPVRKFLLIVCAGVALTAFVMLLVLYLLTENSTIVIYGLFLTAALFAWGVVFLIFFQKKLSEFTNSLCQTLDGMMNGSEKPEIDVDAETSLARISHRLERLYNRMQTNSFKVEADKTKLQSLVSDLSHQIKTPIANLKMINETLLTRSVSEEKQWCPCSNGKKADCFIRKLPRGLNCFP